MTVIRILWALFSLFLTEQKRIIDIASTRVEDGGCYQQYQPLTKKGDNEVGVEKVVKSVTVDGNVIEGNVLTAFDGKKYTVVVTMG